MVPMPESLTSPDAKVTPEVLLAEMKGMAAAQSARFDGIEREQGNQREWMSRLSDAIDRQVALTSRFIGFETRLGHVETDMTDIALDVAKNREDILALQKDNVRAGVIRSGIAALIGGAITAVATSAATGWFGKLLHIPHG